MAKAFAGYEIVERVYTSARSTVDRAVRIADHEPVILKRSTGSPCVSDRVQQEHDLLALVRGDGVVSAYELARDGAQVVLVLEPHGDALSALISKGAPPVLQVLEIGIDVAKALRRIHASGVIHKDINPNNIVYDPAARRAKIIDFDIAARVDAIAAVGPGALEGTLSYIAPEQTGRLHQRIDARTDLYSLGVTLYELVAGVPPFAGDDALSLVHAHLATVPTRLDEIQPGVPRLVADIVAKLLAKVPDHRYQTASGLVADLSRCHDELVAGCEPAFALGRHDGGRRVAFADRLYGRAPEVRALADAFGRTATGTVETVLVAGYSGVGKSSLVRELHGPVVEHRGYVGEGKFDQLHRDVPYSAVIAAVGGLVAQILAEPSLERWRAALVTALGHEASFAASVVPAIERVIGPVPPPPVLAADQVQRRVAESLSRLVQVFSRREHPLVLVLDDMQWADTASLHLLSELTTSDRTEALLVIVAYRDNEVDPSHPFAVALTDYERRGATLSKLELGPLSPDDTAEMLGDALGRSPDEVRDVASLVWDKTAGNPFFIRQFVEALDDDGYIEFDASANAFTLEVEAIERAGMTDNVADLLARKLARFAPTTSHVLVTAAAVGNAFDVPTLVEVTELTAAEIDAALAPAVIAGMVVSRGTTHYAFAHDRIQETAYAAASSERRERLHLAIGRRLLAAPRDVSGRDAELFDIVHHLSRGRALIVDEVERTQFVDLGTTAARAARRAGAYDVGATILRAVCESLAWETQYPAAFAASLELAEVLSLDGHHAQARALLRDTYARATDRDRVRLDTLDTTICTGLGDMQSALVCVRRGAALLDIDLPTDPAALDGLIGGEIATIMAAIAAQPIAKWIELPEIRRPELLEVMTLLTNATPASYQREPQLMVLICSKMVSLSLEHGNCGGSARGYATFAIVLWTMGNYEAAFQLGQLAVDVVRRVGARELQPSVDFIFATFAMPWQRPLTEAIDRLRATVASGIEAGDVAHAGYAALYSVIYRAIHGAPLQALVDEVRRYRELCTRLGLVELDRTLDGIARHANSFMSVAAASEEIVDFAATQRVLESAPGSQSLLVVFRVLELERRYWRKDFSGAQDLVRRLEPTLVALPACAVLAEFRFYASLTAIATGDLGDLETHRSTLSHYAEICPHNYRHMSVLVEAEAARAAHDIGRAMSRYDDAINAAAEAGFLKVEILAHELAAQFWLDQRKPDFAAVHLAHARDRAEVWGALPRARDLEVRRRQLGTATDHASRTGTRTQSVSSSAATLDFATVVKASHAIANDMVLDSLLGKIMAIVVENTGAQTGSIVLQSEGALLVHASARGGTVTTMPSGAPIAGVHDLSEGIVRYVMRTSEYVVLDDASRHQTFRTDAYVRERRPRSVLCMPLVRNEIAIGAVYLENSLVAGAFTRDRFEALGILVSQLAISIENAAMFARVASYRDHLEELVAERTRELTDANERLTEHARVRERMESELRLAQKLQSVGQLAAGVAHEINTPIQYVGDSVHFLSDAFEGIAGLIDVVRASVGGSGEIDVEAIRRAEEAAGLDYLRDEVPSACARAAEGITRVSVILRAMNAFSHPDQHEQAEASINAGLETTLVVARNEYRNLADVETDFGDLPPVVCHSGELNQVFLNLIVNAAHAIESVVGTSGDRGTISISTRCDDETVVVTISDTGSGIADDIRDRVFDPFFTTKPVGRGTGQGLALARTAIVDRHGGSLDFARRPGGGTSFVVRIPISGQTSTSRVLGRPIDR